MDGLKPVPFKSLIAPAHSQTRKPRERQTLAACFAGKANWLVGGGRSTAGLDGGGGCFGAVVG
jgi:hypothetical protein